MPTGGVERERLTVEPEATLAEEVSVFPGDGVPVQGAGHEAVPFHVPLVFGYQFETIGVPAPFITLKYISVGYKPAAANVT